MLRNYLKIAYRNLLKNKVFSLINILGLAIGMAACLLILQYVRFELSYDKFHEKSDRIYRASLYQYKEGTLDIKSARTFPTIGRELRDNFPETVESFVRMHRQSGIFARTDIDQSEYFDEERVYYVDASFFDVFSFPLLMGNAAQALVNPNT
ncbi:MAG: ABC transporter permease, partial [Bacteroidota bacterium]